MAEAARHLHAVHVDPATGERIDNYSCPDCKALEVDNRMLERELRGKRAHINRLEADRDAEARQHELWPRAVRLFDIWREASGHLRAEWNSERFWLCLPALKKFDDYWIERAIAGIAYDPFTKPARNGRTIRYDKWETLFGKTANVGVYAERAPKGYEPPPAAEVTDLARGIAEFVTDRARLIDETEDGVDIARVLVEIDRRVREFTTP